MDVLIKPVITEKMTDLGEKLNRYAFIVDKRANKLEIRSAVEKMYGVTVESVNTMNYNGKKKVRYTKSGTFKGSTPDIKKAIVTVAKGEAVDFYSNI